MESLAASAPSWSWAKKKKDYAEVENTLSSVPPVLVIRSLVFKNAARDEKE